MKKVLAVVAAIVLLSGCGAKKPQGGLKNASYSGCEHIQDDNAEFECFNNKLAGYLAYEYKYPEAARSLGVEGKIYVNFVVESDGSISNVTVVKGLDALLDAEAIRAVRALPTMIPATYDGKPVRIQYTVPINANLK
jgi:TonB family protein